MRGVYRREAGIAASVDVVPHRSVSVEVDRWGVQCAIRDEFGVMGYRFVGDRFENRDVEREYQRGGYEEEDWFAPESFDAERRLDTFSRKREIEKPKKYQDWWIREFNRDEMEAS